MAILLVHLFEQISLQLRFCREPRVPSFYIYDMMCIYANTPHFDRTSWFTSVALIFFPPFIYRIFQADHFDCVVARKRKRKRRLNSYDDMVLCCVLLLADKKGAKKKHIHRLCLNSTAYSVSLHIYNYVIIHILWC